MARQAFSFNCRWASARLAPNGITDGTVNGTDAVFLGGSEVVAVLGKRERHLSRNFLGTDDAERELPLESMDAVSSSLLAVVVVVTIIVLALRFLLRRKDMTMVGKLDLVVVGFGFRSFVCVCQKKCETSDQSTKRWGTKNTKRPTTKTHGHEQNLSLLPSTTTRSTKHGILQPSKTALEFPSDEGTRRRRSSAAEDVSALNP